MKTILVNESSPLLNEVVNLGKKNSSTLGFLPKGAYQAHALEGKIIAAIDKENNLIGYLLFSISNKKNIVYIVHLCTKASERCQGIAHKLFEHLTKLTKENYRGIRVHCRRDYEASQVWPKLGFSAFSEIPGRSKQGSLLTVWWYDHGKPTLFSYENFIDSKKQQIVIDANVFISLLDPQSPKHKEAILLTQDWLSEEIELCVTSELLNEIDRQDDEIIRNKSRTLAQNFITVPGNNETFNQVYQGLKKLFPTFTGTRNESDLRHLTRAITSNIRFFVTNDRKILNKSERVYKNFSILILRPTSLIIDFDSIVNNYQYQPKRLEGSTIKYSNVHEKDISSIEDTLFNQKESKIKFVSKLHNCIINHKKVETRVIKNFDEHLGIIAFDRSEEQMLTVPILRLSKTAISSTIAFNLVKQINTVSIEEERSLTIITESFLSNEIEIALTSNGFTQIEKNWVKVSIIASLNTSELMSFIKTAIVPLAQVNGINMEIIFEIIKSALSTDKVNDLLKIERMFFPLKIKDLDIPNFIVPIKPLWAMNLFDYKLGEQDIFGSDPRLILQYENAYYRAPKPRVLNYPSRILWYVSQGNKLYHGVKALRASAYIDEIFIGTSKSLYGKYKRLGVYKYKDVDKLAKQSSTNELMGFKFSGTQMLKKSITYENLISYWKKKYNKKISLQGPIKIKKEDYLALYKLGTS